MLKPVPNIPKKRRWWIAFLLNLLTGYCGYIYLGRPKRAVAVFGVCLMILALLFLGPGHFMADPRVYLGFTILAVSFVAFLLIDVIVLALRSKGYRLKWMNQPPIYGLCFVFVLLINIGLGKLDTHGNAKGAYAPSSSMVPTILVDDFFTIDRTLYQDKDPERGDVIVFRHHKTDTEFVKRIIGLPNETVIMRNGRAEVDGTLAQWRNSQQSQFYDGKGDAFSGEQFQSELLGISFPVLDAENIDGQGNDQAFQIPADAYFVLGDNRDNSLDSRFGRPSGGIGFVSRDQIVGKVIGIYFSEDTSRMFKSLEPQPVD